jgi:hypothetical protein
MKAIRNRIRQSASTRRGKATITGILLVLLIAVVLAIVYWNAIKKQLIRDHVKLKVREKTERLYNIHYDNMELDEVGGNLSISNLTLQYDSTRYLIMKEKKNEPPMLFRIEIPSIIVTGIQTPKALLTQEIVGGKLQITRPVIEILYTHGGKNAGRRVPQEEVYKQILGELERIKIDTLLIVDAQIITQNMQTGKQELRLMDTHMELRDVVIDSAAGRDSSRILFSKQLFLSCSTLLWSSPDQLYTYKVENIVMHSAYRQINAGRFRIIPTLSETEFAARKAMQADRFNIDIKQISFRRINFQRLMKEELMADSIVIGAASFKIYRDMTMPPDTRSKIGTYPHQKVADIPFPLEIKKMILKNSFVEYKEKGRLLQKTGKVTFGNVNAVISNVTNKKSAPQKTITADIQARFLNRFPVQTLWTFYLFSDNGRFDIKGHLGALNATALNAITEPLGGARVKEGHIHDLRFDFKGYDYGMDGTVKFLYDDLKVALLKKDKDTKALKEKKLLSWGANIFIKNSNPSKKEAPRVVDVHFDRVINRSIFHLSWKTLFEGVKATALPPKKEKK